MSKWAVLSGGGSKGAFELGVVCKLKELEPDLEYNGFAGISVGALHSAMFSQGNLAEMCAYGKDLWFNKIKGNSSIWKHRFFKWLILSAVGTLLLFGGSITAFFMSAPMWVTALLGTLWLASLSLPYVVFASVKSLYDSSPLKKLVYKYYDPEKTKAASKKVIVGAVSWKTGVYETATEDNPDIKDWVLASSAFPLFLDNIKIADKWYTDGGIRDTLPLKDAIKAGATDIDVFLASPLIMSEEEALPALTGQLMRTLHIMTNEILRNDLLEIARLHPGVKIRVFMPEKPLLDNSLSFDPKVLRYMFEEGQKAALHPMTLQEVNDTISGR
jgi:predicted acylesterase/phospholipase RssA